MYRYIKIAYDIKLKIISGQLISGDKLPSYSDLAKIYNVNKNTIQKVCRCLIDEEICYYAKGKGIFVTEHQDIIIKHRNSMINSTVREFVDNMHSLNISADEIIDLLKERFGSVIDNYKSSGK